MQEKVLIYILKADYKYSWLKYKFYFYADTHYSLLF